MKNIAIILAGGVGNRFNAGLPKQFLKIAGKTILEHTISVFQKNEYIDEIAIISNREYVHEVENMVIKNSFTKVRKVLNGGKERYDSTLAALSAYDEDENNLIIHDAVRPLVDDRIINDTVKALTEGSAEAAAVAIETTDTIFQVDKTHCSIEAIPDRHLLYRAQTPQAFKTHILKQAYRIALKDPDFTATDDCGIVKKYMPDVKIQIIRGENRNIKLTYKEDLYLLERLFHPKDVSFDSTDL